ncbi:unnamed protein product [Anisakis simplex]|uniref:Ribosomal RNA large subunit methyltransferase K/L-like methyltransferase domain-containing protein n=1 Tax=Anisakis simplex TaxID=6269 RepID=A0A3P6NK99_ANISI|nr:unnamed protein product [Anisakis simplex]
MARQLKRYHCEWKSLLRGSIQFEVCVHISDGHIFIGVPLTRVPLSSRPYLLRNALRSTVCDAMLSLANIQPGMFVVDFTCGSSSILVQAAHDLAGKCFLLGCDIREESLRMSAENRGHLRSYDAKNYTIELLAADVKCDYLRLECIDRIVCDLPFGQNYGNEEDSLEILKSVINILSRCSAACEAVLLVAASQQPIVGSILPSNVLLESVYPISLGNTQGTLIKLTHRCEQNIATNNSSSMVNV